MASCPTDQSNCELRKAGLSTPLYLGLNAFFVQNELSVGERAAEYVDEGE